MKWTKLSENAPQLTCNICQNKTGSNGYIHERKLNNYPITLGIAVCSKACKHIVEINPSAVEEYFLNIRRRAIEAYKNRDLRQEEAAKQEFTKIFKEAAANIGLKLTDTKDS